MDLFAQQAFSVYGILKSEMCPVTKNYFGPKLAHHTELIELSCFCFIVLFSADLARFSFTAH